MAFSSLCPPDRKVTPTTDAGTVLCRAEGGNVFSEKYSNLHLNSIWRHFSNSGHARTCKHNFYNLTNLDSRARNANITKLKTARYNKILSRPLNFLLSTCHRTIVAAVGVEV